MKKQKTLLVFLSILSIVALLAVLSSPQLLGYFQNKRQSEAEQESIREQQAAREMAAKGIAEYNGLTIELTRTSLIHNINDTGIKEEDFCVSQMINEDGSIIPDMQIQADTLLTAELELCNIEGEPFKDADYILLSFDFQSKALLERNLDTVPMLVLLPHGPEGEEGKDYNRLYLDREKAPEPDSLCLAQGEAMTMKVGFLINEEWLKREFEPCLIVSTDFGEKDISLPIMEEHT